MGTVGPAAWREVARRKSVAINAHQLPPEMVKWALRKLTSPSDESQLGKILSAVKLLACFYGRDFGRWGKIIIGLKMHFQSASLNLLDRNAILW